MSEYVQQCELWSFRGSGSFPNDVARLPILLWQAAPGKEISATGPVRYTGSHFFSGQDGN